MQVPDFVMAQITAFREAGALTVDFADSEALLGEYRGLRAKVGYDDDEDPEEADADDIEFTRDRSRMVCVAPRAGLIPLIECALEFCRGLEQGQRPRPDAVWDCELQVEGYDGYRKLLPDLDDQLWSRQGDDALYEITVTWDLREVHDEPSSGSDGDSAPKGWLDRLFG